MGLAATLWSLVRAAAMVAVAGTCSVERKNDWDKTGAVILRMDRALLRAPAVAEVGVAVVSVVKRNKEPEYRTVLQREYLPVMKVAYFRQILIGVVEGFDAFDDTNSATSQHSALHPSR